MINRERDYAGLTALTGMDNVLDAETEAQQMVSDYERDHWVDGLWDKVNAVTKATLQKTYESGLINKATYDDISGMYGNYIPLRGFDDKTSDEAYAYLTDKHSAFNAPIKTANGRKSKADDPFANMEAMAESAIMQGNRNTLVKQKFLNFALNHPSDLVSVSDLWLWHNDVADEWQPINLATCKGRNALRKMTVLLRWSARCETLNMRCNKPRRTTLHTSESRRTILLFRTALWRAVTFDSTKFW